MEQRFLIYIDAADYDTASNKKKISLLLHAIESEGIDQYNTFQFLAADRENPDDDDTLTQVTFASSCCT